MKTRDMIREKDMLIQFRHKEIVFITLSPISYAHANNYNCKYVLQINKNHMKSDKNLITFE